MSAKSRALRPNTRGACCFVAVTAVICLLLPTSEADASVSRLCEVSYLTPQGWTTPMRLDVVFQSGRDLNKTSTNYFSYSPFGKYALVPYEQGQTAIVEISASLVPDSNGFSNENFYPSVRLSGACDPLADPRLTGTVSASFELTVCRTEVNSGVKSLFSVRSEIEAEQINNAEKGRKWRIVAKTGVPPRFIDSRVEGEVALLRDAALRSAGPEPVAPAPTRRLRWPYRR